MTIFSNFKFISYVDDLLESVAMVVKIKSASSSLEDCSQLDGGSQLQGQKFASKWENPFRSGILQESMDSYHITLYDKLNYLREST